MELAIDRPLQAAAIVAMASLATLLSAVRTCPARGLRMIEVAAFGLAAAVVAAHLWHAQISAAARELDVRADPAAVQDVDLTIDALSRHRVIPFWRAVLGYEQVGEDDLLDPRWRTAAIWFQPNSAAPW